VTNRGPKPAGRSPKGPARGSPVRVVVVDDMPAAVRSLSDFLQAQAQCEVIGTAMDGAAAVALVLELHPDVVLMDLEMPKVNGLEAARSIRKLAPHVAVIILSVGDGEERREASLAHGAQGFVPKHRVPCELMPAMNHAVAMVRKTSPTEVSEGGKA